jgi:nickel transport protein
MVLIALLVILFEPGPVLAHKVNVFAYVDIDKLAVEGYFGGKAAAVNCPVELFDGEGKKVMEGQTDEKGTWSVKLADLPPIKGDLLVVLAAGMGHRAEYTLPAADLACPLKAEQRLQANESRDQVQSNGQTPAPGAAGASGTPTDVPHGPAVLTGMPIEALSARLDRLEAMLSNQQKMLIEQKTKGPSLTEIIGGIGWIFGIVGVAAYCLSRKGSKT